jgi:hypothetical protein
MVYSFKSFVSARALPFNSSLWASTGGALGSAASCDLMVAIESVVCTDNVNDAGGFADLNVNEICAAEQREIAEVAEGIVDVQDEGSAPA